jgi:GMP synthase (glutamine-hydrolysing)
MLLVVDNGSVYTKNLIDLLNKLKIKFDLQTPESLNLETIKKYDSFILSGRRKNEKKINKINSKIIKHSIQYDKKLLGICYGAEILALTLGGTIRKINSLQKGSEKIRFCTHNELCNDTMLVFESHNFEISKLPDSLTPIGESDNCKYEVIQYEKKPIFGTQFHPEMSDDGHKLIEKFYYL